MLKSTLICIIKRINGGSTEGFHRRRITIDRESTATILKKSYMSSNNSIRVAQVPSPCRPYLHFQGQTFDVFDLRISLKW